MRILIIFLLVFSFTASAQGKTFRILYLNRPADAPRELFIFDGKTSQEVELPSMNFSPVYRVRGGDMTLYLSNQAYALPEEVDPNAPLVRIPESIDNFYLLIFTDRENPLVPVLMRVVPYETTDFKEGEMLWFNLTDNLVGGKVGQQKLRMKPRSHLILNPPADELGGYRVDIRYKMPEKEPLYPIYKGSWSHRPESRMVVFVMNQEGSRTPLISGFNDYRPKPSDESAEPSNESAEPSE